MRCFTCWLALAYYTLALASGKQYSESNQPPAIVQSDDPEASWLLLNNEGVTELPLNDEGVTELPLNNEGVTELPLNDGEITELPLNIEELAVDVERKEIEENNEDDEEDKIGKLARDFMDTNLETVAGQQVFEGDILLTAEQWRAVRERKGLANLNTRWPEGPSGFPLVPYIFTSSIVETATIVDGMNHWMEHTCLKFEETTNTNQPHLQFINGSGCYSYLGMLDQNGQDVSIGKGCNYLGTVAHEIGHAIGFVHEQSRHDRDEHVVINFENIRPGKEHNFQLSQYPLNDYGIEYDYSSVMHYGSTAFTINGVTTVATIYPPAQELIGQRSELSHRDKQLANLMYGCIDKWLAECGVASDSCQNGGYFGAGCICVCPPGTSGSSCETVTGGYYDALVGNCTEKITTEGTITSPNYPSSYPKGDCIKWIIAPECHVPKLTFSAFELYPKITYYENQICYFDALEIRIDNTTSGVAYCEQEISPGQIFTGTSQELVLFFRSRTFWLPGWSCELTFEQQEGCQPTTTNTTASTDATPTNTITTTATATTMTSNTDTAITTTPITTTDATTATEPITMTTTTMTTTPTTITTTSMTTTPPPTTTTTTTTPAPAPKRCLIQLINGVYYWSSPDFGIEPYPNNFRCGVIGSLARSMLKLRLEEFKLQRKKRRQCVDGVEITLLYDRKITLCGSRRQQVFMSPSFNIRASFFTDDSRTYKGFNISLTRITTPCHEIITPAAGETGTIISPRREKYCEYRIQAPPGSRVQVDQVSPRIRRSRGCTRDWLLLNGNSEKMYPKATSTIICGSRRVNSPLTSSTDELYVAYQGTRSRGFRLKYTILP